MSKIKTVSVFEDGRTQVDYISGASREYHGIPKTIEKFIATAHREDWQGRYADKEWKWTI